MLLAAPARAQELNYQTFLIGPRAMGMGGAFTAVADDPSAAYHNPAGLGIMRGSSATASLTATAIQGYTVEDAYGNPLGREDLEYDAFPRLPLFVGLGQKFGDRTENDVRQHGIAISVVRPTIVDRRFRIDRFDEERGVATSLRVEHEDEVAWYGVSYGVHVGHGLSLGIGGWLSIRSLLHTEDELVASGVIPAGAGRSADLLQNRESNARLNSYQLMFRGGLLWQPHDQWRLGFMVQPGGINLNTSASLFNDFARTGAGNPPPVETLRFFDQDGLPGESPTPWQFRLGGYFRESRAFGMSADVALYTPLGSAEDPVETFGPPQPDADTGEVPSPGRFIARQWYSDFTVNAAVGIDTVIEDVVPIQAGVFTDLSAAPAIEGPTATYAPPQIHAGGVSLAGGVTTGEFDFSIGSAAVFGWGTGLGTNPDPDAPQAEAYLPVNVRSHTIYFYLSGTERVAAQLVTEILRGVRQEDPDAEQELEEVTEELRDSGETDAAERFRETIRTVDPRRPPPLEESQTDEGDVEGQ